MQIDDEDQATALMEKLKVALPISVYPTQDLAKSLRQQGQNIDPNRAYEIDSLFYTGEMGGITCTLKADPEDKEQYSVSITHLIIDPTHPLAAEVEAYQRQRVRRLKLQDSRGFAAELLAGRSQQGKKKTGRRGFGF